MPVTRSPEIESVVLRVIGAWGRVDGAEVLASLVSSDPNVRVLGSDVDELWTSHDEIVEVRHSQAVEMGEFDYEVESIEGFEDGTLGWAILLVTLSNAEGATKIRSTAVLRLEKGVWRVIQWHNSVPVANRVVFGTDLTTTLSDLVTSVLEGESELEGGKGTEGTMTLVFTDIVDSTKLAEAIGDASWTTLIREHEHSIRRITASEGGSVVKFLGDGSMLSFPSARAAVRTAMRVHQDAAASGFAVRVGIHTGEVTRAAHDLRGLTVNKAARIAALAGANETMVSSTTRDLVGSMDGVEFGAPVSIVLKGLSDSHLIIPASPTADPVSRPKPGH